MKLVLIVLLAAAAVLLLAHLRPRGDGGDDGGRRAPAPIPLPKDDRPARRPEREKID